MVGSPPTYRKNLRLSRQEEWQELPAVYDDPPVESNFRVLVDDFDLHRTGSKVNVFHHNYDTVIRKICFLELKTARISSTVLLQPVWREAAVCIREAEE